MTTVIEILQTAGILYLLSMHIITRRRIIKISKNSMYGKIAYPKEITERAK